jgi:tetratricopeptide (TPR) repeat protein
MGTTAAAPVRAGTEPQSENQFIAWLQARQKVVSITVGAIVILGLIAWYVVESGRRKQVSAMGALDVARGAMEAGNYGEAATGLQRVAQSFGGTDAAFEAILALNQVRLLQGQGQLAVDELRKFIESNPPAAFAGPAHAHLAIALENTGKTGEATAEYLRAAELSPESFRKVDALLNAARTYRVTGKEKEAVAILEDIIKRFPKEEAGVAEAQVRLAEILQRQR